MMKTTRSEAKQTMEIFNAFQNGEQLFRSTLTLLAVVAFLAVCDCFPDVLAVGVFSDLADNC